MRDLKINEVQEVSGGPAPLIGYIAAIVLADVALISVTAGMLAGAEDQAKKSKK